MSTAYTEYSIHRVQHTLSSAYTEHSIHPSTAYMEYCIHRILHHPNINCLPLPASVSSLCRQSCTKFPTLRQLRVIQWKESKPPSHHHPELPPPDWPPPSNPPISLSHGLQVHLQTRSIMASNCISKPAHITASKCISNLAWLPPGSVSPYSHNYGRQVDLQTPSITMWWNGGPTGQTAHHQHSAAPGMLSKEYFGEAAVLARGG